MRIAGDGGLIGDASGPPRGDTMGTTYTHAVASLDGYISDEHDRVGPLHDWYFQGDHPLVDDDHADVHGGAPFRVSAASVDYVRGIWSRQKVLVIGRHQFDLTDGWEGHPPASDHVVVVSHRARPAGWHPEAPYHFAPSVEEAMALARQLAAGGDIGVGAGDVGGQALALGLVDRVAIDLVPVVFGRGKPYFGSLADGHAMLGDPDVVVQGEGVLHLSYPVRAPAVAAGPTRPDGAR
jgi:dihydrofolate reductase